MILNLADLLGLLGILGLVTMNPVYLKLMTGLLSRLLWETNSDPIDFKEWILTGNSNISSNFNPDFLCYDIVSFDFWFLRIVSVDCWSSASFGGDYSKNYVID